MLDGKKVKRDIWKLNEFCFFDEDDMEFRFSALDGQIIEFDLTNYGTDTFEIYEEPKHKETVTIEKWLVTDNHIKEYDVFELVKDREVLGYKKVKLLDTYEVTL